MKQLKKILSVLLVLAMIVAYVPPIAVSAETETKQITITFDANKTDRESQNSNSQVWKKDGLTFTNNKDSSSNAVGDYSDPVRIYQGSGVVIECENMTKIVIVSDGTSKYKTALTNTLNKTGATYTTSGNNYTITFAEPVDSFSMPNFTAQARFKSITVSALVGGGDEGGSEGGETPSDPVMHDVSFNLNGYEGAAAPEAIQVEEGKAYGDKLPSALEREGFLFCGWFMDKECTGTDVKATDTVNGTHTLYAKWIEIVKSEIGETTIDFSSTAHRVSWDANSQVWTNGGITLTNKKVSDSNAIVDASNPARFYKNSTIEIVCAGNFISKVEFTANTDAYATALGNSFEESSDYTVAVDGKIVTVTLTKIAESFNFALSGGQVRMDSITVTVSEPAPAVFDVSFDLNGAEGTAPATRQVEEGAAYGELPEVSREGYTFDGWYKTADCSGEAVTAEDTVSEEHTLYAKWTYIPTEDSSDIVENWGLTLKDEVVVKFNMTFTPETLADAGAYVEVKVDDEITKIAVADVAGPLEIPVSAAQMTDEITLCVVKGNENRGEEMVFTVRQYCETILADEKYAAYHPLVKEMLNYGGYAQAYFGHNTDNMANEGLKDVGLQDISADAAPEKVVSGEIEGISYYGASLLLRDKVALRFYFTVTGDIAEYTFKVNGKEVNWGQKNGMYYIDASDIPAWDLATPVTVTVNDTLTITNSPMNYIVGMSNNSTSGLSALVKALYNYHLAAKAFMAQG